jgi:hypothetical protein
MFPSGSDLAGLAQKLGTPGPVSGCLTGFNYMVTPAGRKLFLGWSDLEEKARTKVLNLLVTPERAATLACSMFITSLPRGWVNTSKPLRAAIFSCRNSTKAPRSVTL